MILVCTLLSSLFAIQLDDKDNLKNDYFAKVKNITDEEIEQILQESLNDTNNNIVRNRSFFLELSKNKKFSQKQAEELWKHAISYNNVLGLIDPFLAIDMLDDYKIPEKCLHKALITCCSLKKENHIDGIFLSQKILSLVPETFISLYIEPFFEELIAKENEMKFMNFNPSIRECIKRIGMIKRLQIMPEVNIDQIPDNESLSLFFEKLDEYSSVMESELDMIKRSIIASSIFFEFETKISFGDFFHNYSQSILENINYWKIELNKQSNTIEKNIKLLKKIENEPLNLPYIKYLYPVKCDKKIIFNDSFWIEEIGLLSKEKIYLEEEAKYKFLYDFQIGDNLKPYLKDESDSISALKVKHMINELIDSKDIEDQLLIESIILYTQTCQAGVERGIDLAYEIFQKKHPNNALHTFKKEIDIEKIKNIQVLDELGINHWPSIIERIKFFIIDVSNERINLLKPPSDWIIDSFDIWHSDTTGNISAHGYLFFKNLFSDVLKISNSTKFDKNIDFIPDLFFSTNRQKLFDAYAKEYFSNILSKTKIFFGNLEKIYSNLAHTMKKDVFKQKVSEKIFFKKDDKTIEISSDEYLNLFKKNSLNVKKWGSFCDFEDDVFISLSNGVEEKREQTTFNDFSDEDWIKILLHLEIIKYA